MALTEQAVKNFKPSEEKYTKADNHGLTLLVMPDGAKYWRLRYRFGGKRRMIAVGRPYPDTTLAEARAKAAEFRTLIAAGTDPADKRRVEKLVLQERVANTFGEGAEAWHAFRAAAWSPRTAEQVREYLDRDLLPKLRSRPLDSIAPQELGALVSGIEERGAFDVAKKARQWLKSIFAYARAKGWSTNNPAQDLAAIAKKGPGAKPYAHLSLSELPAFLTALNGYEGSNVVRECARLALWTANRPGVTRTLRWSEVDLEAGLWTIDRGRDLMKRGYYHLTPLPTQAVTMLRELHKVSGSYEYVFIGRNDPRLPISDGAVSGMIKRIGYRKKQTAHGFRHVVSTALNEKGYDPDWVERQLAHKDPDKIRGTYNKAMYLEPRRKMMQDWADYLDAIQRRAQVITLRRDVA